MAAELGEKVTPTSVPADECLKYKLSRINEKLKHHSLRSCSMSDPRLKGRRPAFPPFVRPTTPSFISDIVIYGEWNYYMKKL